MAGKKVNVEPEGPATDVKIKGRKINKPVKPAPNAKDPTPVDIRFLGWFPQDTEVSVRYASDTGGESTVVTTISADMDNLSAAAEVQVDLNNQADLVATVNAEIVSLLPEAPATAIQLREVLILNPPEDPPDSGGVIGGDPAVIRLSGYFVAGTIIEMDYVTDTGGTTTAEYTVPVDADPLTLAPLFAAFLDTMPDLVVDSVDDFLYIWPELPATTVTLLAFRVTAPPGTGGGGDNPGVPTAYVQTISDTGTLGDSKLLSVKRLAQIIEAMTVNSLMSNVLTIMVEETAELAAGDVLELDARYMATLVEQVDVYALVKTSSDLAQGWVMNTEGTQPVSEYSNFEFSSLTYYQGEMYGTTDTGLFKMGGDTDDGVKITSELSSLLLDMGSSRMKRIRSAYLGYTSTNELVLKVRSVDDGQLSEHWYKAAPVTSAEAPREGYVRVGQGLRSRYWQFELTNVDGGDFEIDQLEMYPLYLGRRI